MQELVKAENAKLNVNGIDIERQSNTVTDAPQGITLTLTKKVTDATVTVTKDDTKAKEAIKSWVDAYNSLVDTFSSLTKYTAVEPGEEASDKNGALLGDSVVRTIQTGFGHNLPIAAVILRSKQWRKLASPRMGLPAN